MCVTLKHSIDELLVIINSIKNNLRCPFIASTYRDLFLYILGEKTNFAKKM